MQKTRLKKSQYKFNRARAIEYFLRNLTIVRLQMILILNHCTDCLINDNIQSKLNPVSIIRLK